MECLQERACEGACNGAETKAGERVHLTPTQQRLLGYIAAQTAVEGGARCSKKDFASLMHCDVKTIDRAITHLRRENIIEVEARHLDNGGQLPNLYRVAAQE